MVLGIIILLVTICEKANSVFQAMISHIYFAINNSTKDLGDFKKSLFYSLYETERALLASNKDNTDLIRTVYMTAEKCGLLSRTISERGKFYGDFLELCKDYWDNHSEGHPHRDLILSDLGFAYEKCASVSNDMGNWRQAAKLLDCAISVVKTSEYSSKLKDLLPYQKVAFICAKYDVLLGELYTKYQLHWDIADELNELCQNAESDLNEAIAFCLDAVSDFDQSKKKMSLPSYWNTLIKAYKAMATYFELKKDFERQKYFLIKSFQSACSMYNVCNDDIIYDLIRNIAYLIGNCCAFDRPERIYYLNESLQIAAKLSGTISDDAIRKNMKQFMNYAGGRLMLEYFSMLHPDVDVNNRNFCTNTFEYFKKHATPIADDNFRDILTVCNKYISTASLVDLPEIFSYDSNAEAKESGIFCGMMATIENVFLFGTSKMYRDFKVAYSKIRFDLKGAKADFARIEKTSEDLLALADFMVKKAMTNDTVALACSLLIDLMLKANGNILRIIYDLKLKDEREVYERKEILYYAELRFYSNLFKLTLRSEKVDQAFYKTYRSDTLQMCKGEALGDIRMFSYAIEHGEEFQKKYISSLYGNEPKHYCVYYWEILNFDIPEVNEQMEVVAEYLCKTFDSLCTRRLLYYSNFYECLAMDHAYRRRLASVAENIVLNGYDRYLELSTLYLIRRYAPESFIKEIAKLKRICLHHLIKDIKKNYWMGCRTLYGDFFCNEVVEKATEALRSIDKTDILDPRNHAAKNIPKWAL